MKLAKEIARARAKQSLSVRDVASLANVSHTAVWRAENGEEAALGTMVKVARALRVPMARIRALVAADAARMLAA